MMKVVGITSCSFERLFNNGVKSVEIATSITYSDGSVVQQYGNGADWTVIKEPDEDQRVEIGICKHCDKPIYEDQEWDFSEKYDWKAHIIEEDCKR